MVIKGAEGGSKSILGVSWYLSVLVVIKEAEGGSKSILGVSWCLSVLVVIKGAEGGGTLVFLVFLSVLVSWW